jgi:hypothetical protein
MSRQDKAEAYYHMLEQLADEHEVEYNPAPGPKWVAEKGLVRMPHLNATEMAVMACLIDYAHEEHGFAFPSRRTIQIWTGRTESAVDRALARLKRLGLIGAIERRQAYDRSETTVHTITWQPFFTAYERVEDYKEWRRTGVTGTSRTGVVPENDNQGGPRKWGGVVPENGEHNSLTIISLEKELNRSPTATNEKKKEAIKEEPSDRLKITNEEWRKLRGSQK